jgi:hypothetical protein
MCAPEGRGSRLVATSRGPGLVGDGGSWAIRDGIRRPGRPGSRPGQRAIAACGVGGRAPSVVPEGGWAGGRGVAHPAAPTRSEEIRLCGGGRASHGARALRFLCRRGRHLGPGAYRSMQACERISWERAAADTRRRCHYARPHAARRGGSGTRCFSRSGCPRICPPSHSRPGRNAPPDSRSLRGGGAVGTRRCAKASLVGQSAV